MDTLDQRASRYRAAVDALNEAIERHNEAKAAADLAREELEDAQAEYMLTPAFARIRQRATTEEREAHIRTMCREQVERFRDARRALSAATAALSQAQATERAERATYYTVLFDSAPGWYKTAEDQIRVRQANGGRAENAALDDIA